MARNGRKAALEVPDAGLAGPAADEGLEGPGRKGDAAVGQPVGGEDPGNEVSLRDGEAFLCGIPREPDDLPEPRQT